MPKFTNTQLENARYANLYQFLLDNYGNDFKSDGRDLRMIENHSVTVMNNSAIFTDWSENKHGNGITFLMDYYGYSFQDAVTALLDGYAPEDYKAVEQKRNKATIVEDKKIVLPEKFKGEPRNLYAYLMSRAIPKDTIKALLDAGLMYQDDHRNVVFVNYTKTCYEVRGTNTYSAIPFRNMDSTRTDRFWYFMEGKNPTKVYITEGAIDAISLYELLNHESAMYASLHGVGNHQIIDRILAEERYEVVLAVDNDHSGFLCRVRYPILSSLIPEHKDWNEDLQAMRGR